MRLNINFASKISTILYLQIFLISFNAHAYTYLYEFDTKNTLITHYYPGFSQERRFNQNDKLYLEINKTTKNIYLIGKNSTPGRCVLCISPNPNDVVDPELRDKLLNSKIDFRLRIFDFYDWRIDGNARNQNKPPINYSALELNPHDLYHKDIWNYDSLPATAILEIAGAAILLNFSLIDGPLGVEYFDSNDPRLSYYTNQRSGYLVSENKTYFGIPSGPSISNQYQYIHSFSIENVGKATLVSQFSDANSVPEPTSLGLLALGLPLIRRKFSLKNRS